MNLVSLHSKSEIEGFLRKNALIHLYEIGDLDDFFWPKTIWFALKNYGRIRQIALLYTASSLPVLVAHAEEPAAEMEELLRRVAHYLPKKFYSHMSERSAAVIAEHYNIKPHGLYLKMGLLDITKIKRVSTSEVARLTESDEDELKAFYEVSYPGNWFDPRMLQTGFYFGIRKNKKLVSVAGVHVVSQQYGVAALGNVATHPEHRGQGLATAACARLCSELLKRGIGQIGLNVKADNYAAIASYRKLGFQQVAEFGEFMCTSG